MNVAVNLVRAYGRALAGLTEVTRQRAEETRHGVLGSTSAPAPSGLGAATAQVSSVAGGVAATARTGGHVLLELLRTEVARSAAGLGLASPGEVDRLRRRVEALERQLQGVEAGDDERPTPADMPAVARPPAAPRGARRKGGSR